MCLDKTDSSTGGQPCRVWGTHGTGSVFASLAARGSQATSVQVNAAVSGSSEDTDSRQRHHRDGQSDRHRDDGTTQSLQRSFHDHQRVGTNVQGVRFALPAGSGGLGVAETQLVSFCSEC